MRVCRSALMRDIQALSFVCDDTKLYLDGHPNDRRAIAYYNMQNDKLQEAMQLYGENFGPLTASGFTGQDTWTWIDGPWPWKYEANVDREAKNVAL